MPDTPVLGSTTTRVVDGGLTPTELQEITRPNLQHRLIWMDLFASILPLILGVTLLLMGWFTFAAQPFAGAATFLAGAVVIFGYIYAIRFGNRLRSETNKDRRKLVAGGKIGYWSEQGSATQDQLKRIDRAIRALQAREGAAYDDQAREAVAAVLCQDAHEPTKRQLAIAESDATDPASVAIRTRALADRAQWHADVAKAELLIFELEQEAGEKKTLEPVTAG